MIADCVISPLKDLGKYILTECLWPPVKLHFDYWWHFDNNIQALKDGIPALEAWEGLRSTNVAEANKIVQDDNIPKPWNLILRYSVGKNAKQRAEEIAKLQIDRNLCSLIPSHGPTMDFPSRKSIEKAIIASLTNSSVSTIGICGMGGVGKTSMVQRISKRVREENLFDEVVMVVVSQQIDMLKIQKEIAELLGLKFDVESMSARADKLRIRLMDAKRKIIIFDDVWKSLKLEDLGVSFERGFERCKILLTTRFKDICEEMEAKEVIAMEVLTKEEAWSLFKEKAGNCVEDSILLSLAKDVAAECKGLPIALITVGKALHNKKNKRIWEDSLSQLRRSNPTDFKQVEEYVYKPLKLSYDNLDYDSEKRLFLLCCLFPEDYNIPVEHLTWYSMGLSMFDGIRNIEEARNRTHTLIEKLKSRFLLMDGHAKMHWQMDGRDKHHVKMHDVVRDVAIFIGSKEKKSLEVTSTDLLGQNSSLNCEWMSVSIANEIIDLPLELHFPNLRLLMMLKSISDKDSDISFEGMEDLNVLSFSEIKSPSLPPTLGLVKNLRTLHLYSSNVRDITVIGELASLEIFCCNRCYNIEKLPAEIGRLNFLRLLELYNCAELKTIAFGVISSLVRLEELKILGSFRGWEAEENGKERWNAALTELESLLNLTCLEIEISDCNLAAQEIRLSQKLVKYYINISDSYFYYEGDHEKVTSLCLTRHISVGKWIRLLLRNSECVKLKLVGDGSNSINIAEIENLRVLDFSQCSTVKKLFGTIDCKFGTVFPLLERLNLNELEMLEEICDGTIPKGFNLCKSPNQNVSLCNLRGIHVSKCSNLRYLFSVSMARSLSQLKWLRIVNCDKMEEVLWNENKSITTAVSIEFFPKLKKLWLINLPKLTAICPLNSEPPHDESSIHLLCNEKMEEIVDQSLCKSPNQNVSPCNLTHIHIEECSNLRYLFSMSMARSLLQLESLEINFCVKMEEVLWNENKSITTAASIEFPKLKVLWLFNLPNLTAFCQGVESIHFPNLTAMEIGDMPKLNSVCPLNSDDDTSIHFLCNQKVEIGSLKTLTLLNLKDNISNIWCRHIPINFFKNLERLEIYKVDGIRNLISSSRAINLVSLQYLRIERCQEMVEVIEDEEEIVDLSLFPALKKLVIRNLLKLRSFCQGKHAFELPSLEEVEIDNCGAMGTFTLGSLSTPNIKSFTINERKFDDLKDLNNAIQHFKTQCVIEDLRLDFLFEEEKEEEEKE